MSTDNAFSPTIAFDAEPLANLSEAGEFGSDGVWLDMLCSRPSEHWIRNVRTQWGRFMIGDMRRGERDVAEQAFGLRSEVGQGLVLPVTLNDAEYGNAFVCSPYSGCISYSRSEISLLKSWVLKASLHSLVAGMSFPLKAAKIDRVVSVNNWLLTTNLYPAMDHWPIETMTQLLVDQFPRHAITFRSLNQRTNSSLIQALASVGYRIAPSRQVYFFDGKTPDYLQKLNTRRDQRLLDATAYHVVDHDELLAEDADRIELLYRLLYIDKYSPFNPDVTAAMFEEYRRCRLLTMWGLRDSNGRLDGVVGMFERNGVLTVPLVGYDTSLPKSRGLYRILMAIVLREAAKRRCLLNLSSGAAGFKRLRGGQPSLEYTAVYCEHLPWPRRLVWRVLASLLQRIGGPILHKFEL